MCHPHVFPSGEYWLASRRGKKAKQIQHIQNLKNKTKQNKTECYILHKKHEVLDSNNAIKTLEIFLFSTVSLSGCEPRHYVWLAAVCKFPPQLGLRGKLQVSREGEMCDSRDRLSTSHGPYKPSDTSYLAPCDNRPPGFIG